MMSNEMIAKLSKISNRWTKSDMDRLYINIYAANELYMSIEDREYGQLSLNRRERATGKIWIDVATGEISTKGIYCEEEVASEIAELIAYLCPAEEIIEETAEATETYTVELCCDRWVAGQGFETDGSVLDTFDSSTINLSIPDIINNGDYSFDTDDDSIDYRLSLLIYDTNGDQIDHDIEPIFASTL